MSILIWIVTVHCLLKTSSPEFQLNEDFFTFCVADQLAMHSGCSWCGRELGITNDVWAVVDWVSHTLSSDLEPMKIVYLWAIAVTFHLTSLLISLLPNLQLLFSTQHPERSY